MRLPYFKRDQNEQKKKKNYTEADVTFEKKYFQISAASEVCDADKFYGDEKLSDTLGRRENHTRSYHNLTRLYHYRIE